MLLGGMRICIDKMLYLPYLVYKESIIKILDFGLVCTMGETSCCNIFEEYS